MNPELRMMWMSQYNTDRISLEDPAFFGQPSMGISVIEDVTNQPTMELNPMMSIVGGDFSGQAAAAAASSAATLAVQPPTLIAANANDIYSLAHVGGLQQQLLQHSAMAFQNYAEIIDNDEAGPSGIGADDEGLSTHYVVDDDQYDNYDDGISELAPKQEIINIDDFVMMTDSNSYDGPEMMYDKTVPLGDMNLADANDFHDNELVVPMINHKRTNKLAKSGASTSAVSTGGGPVRNQRKTRKIEPVNRPGLVLKTPIAYKGNIDPSVIPIQKDGMAVCERCGAIGVKHTFYTKSRRFCSMSCARGELYSLVLNSKMSGVNQQQQDRSTDDGNDMAGSYSDHQMTSSDHTVPHNKKSKYRFRITDQSKITQINGYDDSNHDMMSESSAEIASNCSDGGAGSTGTTTTLTQPAPKALRLYRDCLPQEDLPKIPDLESLPTPCPQMDKIISIRRRLNDSSHSYDWTRRLRNPNFFAAPVACFPHAPGNEAFESICNDMKVEVENTDCDSLEVIQPGQTPHSFWVASILKICGYKALMRYEGFADASHDFWVNLCNAEVHSVGWCAIRGKPLIPPRTIQNKYKDWKDFLVGRLSGARTFPSNFYNKVNDSLQSRFRLGVNLECVDKNRISQVRLATVTKIVGKRLFLRYFDSEDGFWCHEDAPIIHPVGWATTVGHSLSAPQDYYQRMLAGRNGMIEVYEDDATIELFRMNFKFDDYTVDGKTLEPSFTEGMKIEAVDPLNLSSICAATVMSVLKFGYIMIRIDSYQPDASGSDWFCYHEKSPSIFPVGFCAANNIDMIPPNGFESKPFTWEAYLKETGSVAAGRHLFDRQVPNHGFKVGMSLECADLMDPRLVCVATVSRVVGRLLKIHFDGWTDEYDQWLDCHSPDIYPVGWCTLTNHKLEGPPSAQATQAVKTTPKSKPQKKRKKKASQPNTPKSHEKSKSRTIALKTNPNLPKLSIKLELKPEHQNDLYYEDQDDDDDFEEDSSSHRSNRSTPQLSVASETSSTSAAKLPPQQSTSLVRTASNSSTNSSVSNSKYIPRLTDLTDMNDVQADLLPETWNVYDVSQFLRVNDCTSHCDTFSRNKVDGKRLFQLSSDEIVTLLGMKVGPALKIFDLITQLKCKINPGKSRQHKGNKAYL